ncbi:microtubule-associated proteins 70-1 [Prunus dulcis]|uniref:Microtubule-associated proteins 70-1 n=1 Tax=Prunus dulcis TaxID=3755 RepID=A0A4Y1RRZ7_PRUDU|nr:microtubule-associated proteins 70-1 [Prunus dulcis]
MNEEKKLLEQEVARAKDSTNRVATVVANEWKIPPILRCKNHQQWAFKATKSNLQSGFNRSNTATAILKQAKSSSRSFDGGCRLLDRDTLVPYATGKDNTNSACDQTQMDETIGRHEERANGSLAEQSRTEHEDYVSGVLYDMLQKEVVSLRKACHEKDQTLKDKDDAIEMLAKKVDTLNKAMEVEAKKMREK